MTRTLTFCHSKPKCCCFGTIVKWCFLRTVFSVEDWSMSSWKLQCTCKVFHVIVSWSTGHLFPPEAGVFFHPGQTKNPVKSYRWIVTTNKTKKTCYDNSAWTKNHLILANYFGSLKISQKSIAVFIANRPEHLKSL